MSFSDIAKKQMPKLVTVSVVILALVAAWVLYQRFMRRPWTRDGQVRADMVKIAPRVSGYLIQVAVQDNQFVRKGDLLFEIDPSEFQLAVDEARVKLDQAREDVAALQASVEAADATVQQQQAAVRSAESKIEEAQANVESSQAGITEAEAGVTSAKAYIEQVEAQLEETRRQAARARRLADQRAGAVEDAEAKEASVTGYEAQLRNAKAGASQSQAALSKAKAALTESKAKLTTAQNGLAESEAALDTAKAGAAQARANLGVPGESNVRIRNAKVQLEKANLNLAWTKITAPADGFITNMNLLDSTFVTAGSPFALFVDATSFRVDAYFQETKLKHIQEGDEVTLTLMGNRRQPLQGVVESIGYAINPPQLAETDGPENLVPTIEPTFEWIRLAQRVPVRIRFKEIPKDLHLVSGTTVSISLQE